MNLTELSIIILYRMEAYFKAYIISPADIHSIAWDIEISTGKSVTNYTPAHFHRVVTRWDLALKSMCLNICHK